MEWITKRKKKKTEGTNLTAAASTLQKWNTSHLGEPLCEWVDKPLWASAPGSLTPGTQRWRASTKARSCHQHPSQEAPWSPGPAMPVGYLPWNRVGAEPFLGRGRGGAAQSPKKKHTWLKWVQPVLERIDLKTWRRVGMGPEVDFLLCCYKGIKLLATIVLAWSQYLDLAMAILMMRHFEPLPLDKEMEATKGTPRYSVRPWLSLCTVMNSLGNLEQVMYCMK